MIVTAAIQNHLYQAMRRSLLPLGEYGVLGGELIGYGTAPEMTLVIGVIMAGGSLTLTAIMPAFLPL